MKREGAKLAQANAGNYVNQHYLLNDIFHVASGLREKVEEKVFVPFLLDGEWQYYLRSDHCDKGDAQNRCGDFCKASL